jgi:hypothetical protein
MSERRDAIPAELRRQVLVEAGHRCAIPTCRHTANIDIHHIIPWESCKTHDFDNLIALCPNCHRMAHDGANGMDKKALRIHKANLSLLNSRYSEYERRILLMFVRNKSTNSIWLPISLDSGINLMYLFEDGLIVEKNKDVHMHSDSGPGKPSTIVGNILYELTEKGRDFISNWSRGEELNNV